MDNIDTSYHALPVVTISNVTAKETKIFEDRKKTKKEPISVVYTLF